MKKKTQKKTKRPSVKEYPFVLNFDPEDKIYIAKSLDLKGCHSQGATPQEATTNIYEAMEGWLETAQLNNISIPPPSKPLGSSKKFLLRIEPQNAYKLEMLAVLKEESLNTLINEAISSM